MMRAVSAVVRHDTSHRCVITMSAPWDATVAPDAPAV
jgi:hypothetical protein